MDKCNLFHLLAYTLNLQKLTKLTAHYNFLNWTIFSWKLNNIFLEAEKPADPEPKYYHGHNPDQGYKSKNIVMSRQFHTLALNLSNHPGILINWKIYKSALAWFGSQLKILPYETIYQHMYWSWKSIYHEFNIFHCRLSPRRGGPCESIFHWLSSLFVYH